VPSRFLDIKIDVDEFETVRYVVGDRGEPITPSSRGFCAGILGPQGPNRE
jgi:hypothetical protein